MTEASSQTIPLPLLYILVMPGALPHSAIVLHIVLCMCGANEASARKGHCVSCSGDRAGKGRDERGERGRERRGKREGTEGKEGGNGGERGREQRGKREGTKGEGREERGKRGRERSGRGISFCGSSVK